ncbi:MAG TPA: hypothetical protein VEA38_03945, partial [Terriglobales bacterium]|nr:hypothetical protein [Terriglobales bacterium]
MTDSRSARVRACRVVRVRAATSRAAGATLCALFFSAAAPASVGAQISAAVVPHVGRSATVPGGAMVGIAAEVGNGPLALRAGVAMDAAGTLLAPMLSNGRASTGAWTSDADVGLNIGRLPLL